MITDPAYNPAYSNFCYETPFMPGFTAYMDTPVIPTMAFADGYNLPDTEYPDDTPAISTVVNSSSTVPKAVGDDGRRPSGGATAHGSIHAYERAAGRQHRRRVGRHHDCSRPARSAATC